MGQEDKGRRTLRLLAPKLAFTERAERTPERGREKQVKRGKTLPARPPLRKLRGGIKSAAERKRNKEKKGGFIS